MYGSIYISIVILNLRVTAENEIMFTMQFLLKNTSNGSIFMVVL